MEAIHFQLTEMDRLQQANSDRDRKASCGHNGRGLANISGSSNALLNIL